MNYSDQDYFIYTNISVVRSWRVKLHLFGASGEHTSYIPYLTEHTCTGQFQLSTTKTTSGILNNYIMSSRFLSLVSDEGPVSRSSR